MTKKYETKTLALLGIFILALALLKIINGGLQQTIVGGQKVDFVQYTGAPVCGNSVCDWWNECKDKLLASRTVEIGNYKVDVSHTYKNCDGWTKLYGYKIYKNGELIDEVSLDCDNGLRNRKSVVFDDLEIKFLDSYWVSWYTFWAMQNLYAFKLPQNAFEFDIYTPETQYFQGENVSVKVIVKNNLGYEVLAKIKTRICQPTAWGKACSSFEKKQYLKPGENTLTYSVPTKYVVDRLEVTPELELWLDLSKITISGLNVNKWRIYNENEKRCGDDYELRNYRCGFLDVNWCVNKGYKFYKLGSFKGNTTIIMIVPKPLYVKAENNICPPGYHLSSNQEYCLRDDLKDLSCLQLGCPVIPNHTYICTSSGICAEIVYVYQDCRQLGCPEIEGAVESYCDENTGACIYKFENKTVIEKEITCKENPSICPSGTVCDKETGACVKTEIIKELVQCKVDSDCYVPCEGITAKCISGYCEYYGSCKPVEVGCKQLGCPEGYVCDEERNVCIRQEGWFEKYGFYLVIGLSLIIIMLGASIWLVKKK